MGPIQCSFGWQEVSRKSSRELGDSMPAEGILAWSRWRSLAEKVPSMAGVGGRACQSDPPGKCRHLPLISTPNTST